MVWKFDVLFVGLLVVVFFSFGQSKQTRSLLLLDLYYIAWRAICDSYHRFYPRPENLFHVTDCRSKGVVPANTLKKLVRKRHVPGGFPGVLPFPPPIDWHVSMSEVILKGTLN